MTTKHVTFDNLPIKDHVRWAHDQMNLDPTLGKESPLVAHHPETLWNSSLYTSQWEELFDWQKRNIPWAHFETPDNFHSVAKRLFSYRLFPNIFWNEEDEEIEKPGVDLIKQVISHAECGEESPAIFEKNKTTIINLLESIKHLNGLLGQINARKLQYQKG